MMAKGKSNPHGKRAERGDAAIDFGEYRAAGRQTHSLHSGDVAPSPLMLRPFVSPFAPSPQLIAPADQTAKTDRIDFSS
jgi:hypothetical protein